MHEKTVTTSAETAAAAAAGRIHSRNQLASISVSGLCYTGQTVVDYLVAMEIGTVLVTDDQIVTAEDPRYPAALTGLRRSTAVRVMRQRQPGLTQILDVDQTSSGAEVADLMVWVIGSGHASGETMLDQAPGNLPLLPVLIAPDRAVVGPLLNTPGAGCPICTTLPSVANDSMPVVSPGMSAPVMAVAAAAFVGLQIQALVRAQRPAAVQHSACIITAADAAVSYHRVSGDPLCACFTRQQ